MKLNNPWRDIALVGVGILLVLGAVIAEGHVIANSTGFAELRKALRPNDHVEASSLPLSLNRIYRIFEFGVFAVIAAAIGALFGLARRGSRHLLSWIPILPLSIFLVASTSQPRTWILGIAYLIAALGVERLTGRWAMERPINALR